MPIKRPVKMLLYAPPGTGKSVFALGFPKPFFICTDGNYEWLEDFGAKEKDHVNISSFAEFEKLCATDFDGYDTIVVDLLEDIYKWNEYEYCKKQHVDHLSDAGGFGKGWDITRTRLFVACSKLLSLPKNVIFLSHESSYVEKDRKGNEKTKYQASNLMNEKFIVMLEGRLRYFLRARFRDEVMPDGKVITHRVLSLVPKSDEYGIIRGVNTDLMPEEIPLDAKTFLQVIGYEKDSVQSTIKKAEPVETEPVTKVELVKTEPVTKVEPVNSESVVKVEPAKVEPEVETVKEVEPAKQVEPIVEQVEKVETPKHVVEKTVVIEEKPEQPVPPVEKPMSQAEKIALIKARLAAKKGN